MIRETVLKGEILNAIAKAYKENLELTAIEGVLCDTLAEIRGQKNIEMLNKHLEAEQKHKMEKEKMKEEMAKAKEELEKAKKEARKTLRSEVREKCQK